MYIITLERKWFKPTYTIGRLILPDWDQPFFCNTLEDTDRGLDHSGSTCDCSSSKLSGITCIPYGEYELIYRYSPKFTPRYGIWMPALKEVPHYEGILFHPGNDPKDTEGCILLGENKQKGKVINSRTWFNKFVNITRPLFDQGTKLKVNIIKTE